MAAILISYNIPLAKLFFARLAFANAFRSPACVAEATSASRRPASMVSAEGGMAGRALSGSRTLVRETASSCECMPSE
ncbi:MAG: hypothetical protein A3A32_02005 [Candidatus Wildermuthbacteria bacterium RIFCSPLOWO2_01_FULL_48_35]|uniref:Uncharacterized protein n=1 Tax=Candidatus Wildermuthbacteria bacterium RIFCSPLOWO2_01_FULL_48_35 TaxID=1802463 RepID=A0A1G2RP48_9BACT|nr:MAG: hypothetical protein A3A32_02005 [Candidatus Wildermuthbacteria bacterium RIFCSPLOWO2_01_FULL_48_35]